MRLDCLLRKEEPVADLAVDQAFRDQLENLDLARRRLLLELLQRLEGDHRSNRLAARGDRVEPGGVLPIPGQDRVTLCSVHGRRIG